MGASPADGAALSLRLARNVTRDFASSYSPSPPQLHGPRGLEALARIKNPPAVAFVAKRISLTNCAGVQPEENDPDPAEAAAIAAIRA